MAKVIEDLFSKEETPTEKPTVIKDLFPKTEETPATVVPDLFGEGKKEAKKGLGAKALELYEKQAAAGREITRSIFREKGIDTDKIAKASIHGFQNPEDSKRFQDEAIQKTNKALDDIALKGREFATKIEDATGIKFGEDLETFVRYYAGLPGSTAGLLADTVTNPVDLALTLLGERAIKYVGKIPLGSRTLGERALGDIKDILKSKGALEAQIPKEVIKAAEVATTKDIPGQEEIKFDPNEIRIEYLPGEGPKKAPAADAPITYEPIPGDKQTQVQGGNYAGNINLDRLSLGEDAEKVIRDTAVQFKDKISEQQRGTITHEMTQKLANKLGMDADKLMKVAKGKNFNDSELIAAEEVLKGQTNKVVELQKKIMAGDNSDATLDEFRQAVVAQANVQKVVSGAKTETGRALQANKINVEKERLAAAKAAVQPTGLEKKSLLDLVKQINQDHRGSINPAPLPENVQAEIKAAQEELKRRAVAAGAKTADEIATFTKRAGMAESVAKPLTTQLDMKMPNSATPDQVRGIIKNAPGITDDIKEVIDLEGFMKGKDKISKKELLDYIEKNDPKISVIEKGGKRELTKIVQDRAALRRAEQLAERLRTEHGIDTVLNDEALRDPDEPFLAFHSDETGLLDPSDIGSPHSPEGNALPAEAQSLAHQVEAEYTRAYSRKEGQPIFAKYATKGGENYREVLLTLPEKEYTNQNFDSGHFKEPNIIAHGRIQDFKAPDGKKVRMIEEIQSDWHQEGREKGYKTNWTDEDRKVYDDLTKEANTILKSNDLLGFDSISEARQAIRQHPDWMKRWEISNRSGNSKEADIETLQRWRAASAEYQRNLEAPPSGPFKKNWPELMFRKLVEQAKAEGADRIAWTTGEQQGDRYNLAKYIKEVNVRKAPTGEWFLDVEGKNGENIFTGKVDSDSKLADYVGKELATKIVKDQPGLSSKDYLTTRTYEGLDLRVGDEGMKAFYDQMIPKVAEKVLKGSKVQTTEIITKAAPEGVYEAYAFKDTPIKVHSIDLNPKDLSQEPIGSLIKKAFSDERGAINPKPLPKERVAEMQEARAELIRRTKESGAINQAAAKQFLMRNGVEKGYAEIIAKEAFAKKARPAEMGGGYIISPKGKALPVITDHFEEATTKYAKEFGISKSIQKKLNSGEYDVEAPEFDNIFGKRGLIRITVMGDELDVSAKRIDKWVIDQVASFLDEKKINPKTIHYDSEDRSGTTTLLNFLDDKFKNDENYLDDLAEQPLWTIVKKAFQDNRGAINPKPLDPKVQAEMAAAQKEILRRAKASGAQTSEEVSAFLVKNGIEKGVAETVAKGLGELKSDIAAFAQKKIGQVLTKEEREITEEMVKQMAKIDLNDPIAVNKFIRDVQKVKTADQIYFVWMNSLLSSPTTHIVNTASNLLRTAVNPLYKAVGAAVEAPRKAPTIYLGEAASEAIGKLKGVSEGMRRAMFTLRHGLVESQLTKFDARPTAIKGPVGEVIGAPTKALASEDEFFKGINYVGEIHAQAYRTAVKEGLHGKELTKRIGELISNPTEEMMAEAEKAATHQTFQDELGSAGQALVRIRNKVPGLRYVLPFLKTPTNIFKEALRTSPAGFISAARKEGSERAIAMGKATVGTGIATFFALKALEGKVTGAAPSDQKEREMFYAQGKQPYSLRIGDRWVSYQRIEPFATSIQLIADGNELYKQGKLNDKEVGEIAVEASKRLAMSLANKTFLNGISNAMNALEDPERHGATFLANIAGGFVYPSGFNRAMTRGFDDKVREPQGKGFQRIKETIFANIPGLSQQVREKLDLFGDPVQKKGNAFERILSPVPTSEVINNPIINELERLGVKVGIPGKVQGKVSLNSDEYYVLRRTTGQTLKAALTVLINSDRYKQMADSQKTKAVEEIIDEAKKYGVKNLGFGPKKRVYFEILGKISKMDTSEKKEYLLKLQKEKKVPEDILFALAKRTITNKEE